MGIPARTADEGSTTDLLTDCLTPRYSTEAYLKACKERKLVGMSAHAGIVEKETAIIIFLKMIAMSRWPKYAAEKTGCLEYMTICDWRQRGNRAIAAARAAGSQAPVEEAMMDPIEAPYVDFVRRYEQAEAIGFELGVMDPVFKAARQGKEKSIQWLANVRYGQYAKQQMEITNADPPLSEIDANVLIAERLYQAAARLEAERKMKNVTPQQRVLEHGDD